MIYYAKKENDSRVEIETFFEEAESYEQKQEEPKKIKIHIAGYVVNEGIIELEEGARVDDAIEKARRANRRRRYNKCKFSIQAI